MPAQQRAKLSLVGQGNYDPAALPAPVPVPAAVKKPTRPVDYENLGNMCAGLWFSGGENVFGPDWVPNDQEREGIPKAFTQYFRAKEIGDIPPGVALCLALGTYSLTRWSKPTVRERIAGFGALVKGRWRSWREGRARGR
jgi:hypothetical protein